MNKLKNYILLVLMAFSLSGCGEVQVYDVDTKFSEVVHVEPVSQAYKSVFIRIKDMTGYASEVSSAVELKLKSLGYKVVTDPADANFKLLVSVIKFGAGNAQDQITFLQAVDPKEAAELAAEQLKLKRTQRSTNIYEKENPGIFGFPFGQRKQDVYADDVAYEETSIRPYADRVGIVDVEVLANNGRNVKTRIMFGVNLRGGFFVSPSYQVDQYGWTRLINRLALAIANIF